MPQAIRAGSYYTAPRDPSRDLGEELRPRLTSVRPQ